MEDFVRRLFSDREFRREFLANPVAIISNSGLSRNDQATALRQSGNLEAALKQPKAGVLPLDGVEWVA
ncbi:MAG: hypothetical protein Q7T05_01095 [Dehalococcoidia bacterium]|nr:hypothetical protein [Dehalococcoidia bacterium]